MSNSSLAYPDCLINSSFTNSYLCTWGSYRVNATGAVFAKLLNFVSLSSNASRKFFLSVISVETPSTASLFVSGSMYGIFIVCKYLTLPSASVIFSSLINFASPFFITSRSSFLKPSASSCDFAKSASVFVRRSSTVVP